MNISKDMTFFGWELGIWKINVIKKKEKSNEFSRPRVWAQGILGKITNKLFLLKNVFFTSNWQTF